MVDNINLLYIKDVRFEVARLPTVSYFCTRVAIPSISTSAVPIGTPFTKIKSHGDSLQYPPLTITFNVDEDLRNYEELVVWMQQYATPTNFNQYTERKAQNQRPYPTHFSDATVFTMTNKDNPNVKFIFDDLFPTEISELEFNLATESPEPLTCSATFEYTKFRISR